VSITLLQSESFILLSWSRAVRKVYLLLLKAQEFATHNILLARMIQLEAIKAPEYSLNVLVAQHSNISEYVRCSNKGKTLSLCVS
jgi:hypothetical protein